MKNTATCIVWIGLAVATLSGGCASRTGWQHEPGSGFVLCTLPGSGHIDTWKSMVARELATVCVFLQTGTPTPSIQTFLVPVKKEQRATLFANEGCIDGWTDGISEVSLVVGTAYDEALFAPIHPTLRHEFTHVVSRRIGLANAAWLQEGLAHEAEDVVRGNREAHLHPCPVELVRTRQIARKYDLRTLLSWDGKNNVVNKELRLLARAFVRFLIEQAPARDWIATLRRAGSTPPDQLSSLEGKWRDWLDKVDILARIENASRSKDERVRFSAANTLLELAEVYKHGVPGPTDETFWERADRIALRFLRDAAMAEPARRYLLFHRAEHLNPTVVDDLASSRDVLDRILAACVRSRRGELYDKPRTRALLDSLDRRDEDRLHWARAILNLPSESAAR